MDRQEHQTGSPNPNQKHPVSKGFSIFLIILGVILLALGLLSYGGLVEEGACRSPMCFLGVGLMLFGFVSSISGLVFLTKK